MGCGLLLRVRQDEAVLFPLLIVTASLATNEQSSPRLSLRVRQDEAIQLNNKAILFGSCMIKEVAEIEEFMLSYQRKRSRPLALGKEFIVGRTQVCRNPARTLTLLVVNFE